MREPTTLAAPLAVAATEELSLDDVYRKHGTLLLRWTVRLAGPTADREDVLQDVLLQVHRALPAFRGDALLTTWLYRITRRAVGRWRRRESLRRWLFGARDGTEDAPSADVGPCGELERQQASRDLYRALDTLSEKHRTAFLLFEMEHLSAEEIARIMETRPGTVWVWLHRARTKLRERLSAGEVAP